MTAQRREPTPAERTLRARADAYRLHSLYDSRELTANARVAFNDRFARQVDPTAPSQQPNDSAEPAATSFNTYSPSVSFASCNTLTPEA